MTETSGIMTLQTIENYAPGSVGQMLEGIVTKVVDEEGKGKITRKKNQILIVLF